MIVKRLNLTVVNGLDPLRIALPFQMFMTTECTFWSQF